MADYFRGEFLVSKFIAATRHLKQIYTVMSWSNRGRTFDKTSRVAYDEIT